MGATLKKPKPMRKVLPKSIEQAAEQGAKASILSNGRINIEVDERSCELKSTIQDIFGRSRTSSTKSITDVERPVPRGMNVVIQIVGSRGDVQPFIALGKVLKQKYGHRIRIATHGTFKDFVESNGLEFFNISGDPAELMAYMVKNPGLMPGMDSILHGDIGRRRKTMFEILKGCWRSCLETGDGMEEPDVHEHPMKLNSRLFVETDPTVRPFIADAIIANPPSMAHIHLGERLGIPVHLMFTMPWSPTHFFAHPLANMNNVSSDPSGSNLMSFAMVDMMIWQGLGDLINDFRTRFLNIQPVNLQSAPALESRLRIPYTYLWSPTLIPKPPDWGSHIKIAGFQFLDLASGYKPDPKLVEWLAAGPPPVYIGFGSIVVEDPDALTALIFMAAEKAGVRALVSKGWGGFGADELNIPDNVFMLGNVPHDWLFKQVSCVCHHGGAGTTAAGIAAGRPTIIVPFFGDQPFWGAMIARAGAGPSPIPNKKLTSDNLAEAIKFCLKPETLEKAGEMGKSIQSETGSENAAESFQTSLSKLDLCCDIVPERAAVWVTKKGDHKLSALAAATLVYEGWMSYDDMKIYRPYVIVTNTGVGGPLVAGTMALSKTVTNMVLGLAEIPGDALHAIQDGYHKHHHVAKDVGTKDDHHDSVSTLTEKPKEQKASPNPPVPTVQRTDSEHGPATLKYVTVFTREIPGSRNGEQSSEEEEEEEREEEIEDYASDDPVEREHGAVEDTDTEKYEEEEKKEATAPAYGSDELGLNRIVSMAPLTHAPPSASKVTRGHLIVASFFTSTHGAGRVAGALIKFPGQFLGGIARGFYHIPEKWGDPSVRELPQVDGFVTGMKAAGTIPFWCFYDAITGVVYLPYSCAREEGGKGFAKGVVWAFGGLIYKPLAGVFALPGLTFAACYAQGGRYLQSITRNYIIAIRQVQGQKHWERATKEERTKILRDWRSHIASVKK